VNGTLRKKALVPVAVIAGGIILASTLPALAQTRDGMPAAQRQEVARLLAARSFTALDTRYVELQRRYEAGEIDDWSLLLQYQPFYERSTRIEGLLTEWIARSPKSYAAHLARGIYYRKVGESKRGSGWIDDVPPPALDALWQYLDLAERDLRASLPLARKPIVSIVHLMNVTKHRDGGQVNRTWLDAAIRIDKTSYGARRRFMYTLRPRWGGSYEEMLAFLKECEIASVPAEHLRIYESIMYIDQGGMRVHQKRDAEALPLYRKALALLDGIDNIERRSSLRAVIYIARRADKLESVAQEIDEAIRLAPHDGGMVSYRAWIKERQHKLAEAWRDFLHAAELGDAYSQHKVGSNFYYGSPPHVTRDQRQGIEWIKRAAEQGYPDAKKFLDSLPK
jgi:hypothetical protein